MFIRVAFFRGRTYSPFAWAIRIWTLSRFNHVEIVLPDGRSLSADSCKGVIWKSQLDINLGNWDIYTLPISSAMLANVIKFADSEIGCKYDWKGIFLSQLVWLNRESKTKWFCSELAAAIIKHAGIRLVHPACWYSPESLRNAVRKLTTP